MAPQEKKFKCIVSNCNRLYVTQRGLINHLRDIHHITNYIPDSNGNLESNNEVHSNENNNQTISKAEEENGWNKDQIELALELSMKEQYGDFIPDDDDILKMSNANICVICGTSKANIAFIDCGHMVTCEKCSDRIQNENIHKRKCPICRKDIKKLLKIYT